MTVENYVIRGRVWKLGDNITTDHIISGKHKFAFIDDVNKMLPYLFEEVIPGFINKVSPGDIIVAGSNFGIGSSREQAPRLIKLSGISAIVAKNFARIFYRNSINIGLPLIEARVIPDITDNGDIITIDLKKSMVINETKNVIEQVKPFPQLVLNILLNGGIINLLKNKGLDAI
ncbi:MAG: 3-isopropylmalate dehydratase [Fervidicoccaceae archaeon]